MIPFEALYTSNTTLSLGAPVLGFKVRVAILILSFLAAARAWSSPYERAASGGRRRAERSAREISLEGRRSDSDLLIERSGREEVLRRNDEQRGGCILKVELREETGKDRGEEEGEEGEVSSSARRSRPPTPSHSTNYTCREEGRTSTSA